MKIVFWGSSSFIIPPLRALLKSKHKLPCIVTQPDKRKDRGLRSCASLVKSFALNNNIEILQPNQLGDSLYSDLIKLRPDLFVVAAYGKILTKRFLAIPKMFSINLHASLLPEFRGPAPINWAIIKGKEETGITVIEMNESIDTGKIVLQKKIPIEPIDNAETLANKLSFLSSDSLMETLEKIESGMKIKFTVQEENLASFAPKLKKRDGLIDWGDTAEAIERKVRGLYPWPGTYSYYKGALIKILDVTIDKTAASSMPIGSVIESSKGRLKIKCKDSVLIINKLQPEGKRKMSGLDFINGYRVKIGEAFEIKNT